MKIVKLTGDLLTKTLRSVLNVEEFCGVRWNRFVELNRLLKGFRAGELTIFSGRTGMGKTTFLSEYSMDLCEQGVGTLWCSFEIPLYRLCQMMVHQFSGKRLTEVPPTELDMWMKAFYVLPMYFLDMYGSHSQAEVMSPHQPKPAHLMHGFAGKILEEKRFKMRMPDSASTAVDLDAELGEMQSCTNNNVGIRGGARLAAIVSTNSSQSRIDWGSERGPSVSLPAEPLPKADVASSIVTASNNNVNVIPSKPSTTTTDSAVGEDIASVAANKSKSIEQLSETKSEVTTTSTSTTFVSATVGQLSFQERCGPSYSTASSNSTIVSSSTIPSHPLPLPSSSSSSSSLSLMTAAPNTKLIKQLNSPVSTSKWNAISKSLGREQLANLEAYFYPTNSRGRTPGLCGLLNMGNTCYMNSVIQCLCNTSVLLEFLLVGDKFQINPTNKLGYGGRMIKQFMLVLRGIWTLGVCHITPRQLKNTVGECNSMFAGCEQHDSQEFLVFLLDSLHEDINEVKQKPRCPPLSDEDVAKMTEVKHAEVCWNRHAAFNRSFVMSVFSGQLRSSLTCQTCYHRSVTFDVFMYLSLPLPRLSHVNPCEINECFNLFLKEEKLTGSSQWFCPRCNANCDATKKIDIWSLPPYLLIHLKRFSCYGSRREKINSLVEFPLKNLDWNQFVKGPKQGICNQYNLYAVSNHMGTIDGGHYTAHCVNSVDQEWYRYDDDAVTSLSPSDVQVSPMPKVEIRLSDPRAEIAALLEERRAFSEALAHLERQIYNYETHYLEDTAQYGNIVNGWDRYLGGTSGSANAHDAANSDVEGEGNANSNESDKKTIPSSFNMRQHQQRMASKKKYESGRLFSRSSVTWRAALESHKNEERYSDFNSDRKPDNIGSPAKKRKKLW